MINHLSSCRYSVVTSSSPCPGVPSGCFSCGGGADGMKTADSEEKGGGENEAAEEVKYVYFFQ